MNIEYPRNILQGATDIGNQMAPQELILMPIRFFVHYLDYLVFITVKTNRKIKTPVEGGIMAKLLWKPSEEQIKKSNMYRFMNVINDKYHQNFSEFGGLYEWSIENIADFWETMWEFADIIASKPYDQVIDDVTKMPGARWFSGARLNFAQNLLRFRDEKVALVFKGEGQQSTRMTYAELYDEVARVARGLKAAGVQSGDRVVGFMPNMPATIVAMLAATSLGAAWSSCSPDFGIKGVLDRFGQIKPKVLFTANGYFFKGKKIDSLERIADILKKLPSIEKVVVAPLHRTQCGYQCSPQCRPLQRFPIFRTQPRDRI